MIKWLMSLFAKRPTPESEAIESVNDENMQAVLQKCWETGKMVIGNVDDNGELTMEVIDDEN